MIAINPPAYTTYTASDLRRISRDYPSMHTGAPEGKKNGPGIAALGAFSAISSGMALGGLLGGLMIAGGVLGGIGALTGNKTLMGIGTIAGIAGGFVGADGGLISSLSEFGGAAKDAAGSIFDSLSESFGFGGGMPPSVDGYDLAGNAIKSAKAGTDVVGESLSGLMPGEDSPMKSVMDTFKGNSGLLSAASGMAQSYMEQPLQEAKIDSANAERRLLDARTASEQQQQGLLAQRQKNMQFQNTGNMPTVDPNAQVFSQAPGAQPGKYAVVMDGQVQYVTADQYAALQAQRSNPNQQGVA